MEIKLAFYKGKGNWKNKVIRWWTKSPYSHVELILPDGDTWVSISPMLTSTVSKRSISTVKDLNELDQEPKFLVANENDLITTPPLEIHALKIDQENHFIVFASGLRGGKDYENDTFRVDPIVK